MQNKINVGIIGKNFGYHVIYKSFLKNKEYRVKGFSFKSKKNNNIKIPKNIKIYPNWKKLVLDKEIDIVVTLSNLAQELCPSFPGNVEQLHWDVPDPFPGWTEDLRFVMKFREVRNIIRSHIDEFLQSHQ